MKFILLSQVKIYHQLSYIEETNKSNAFFVAFQNGFQSNICFVLLARSLTAVLKAS